VSLHQNFRLCKEAGEVEAMCRISTGKGTIQQNFGANPECAKRTTMKRQERKEGVQQKTAVQLVQQSPTSSATKNSAAVTKKFFYRLLFLLVLLLIAGGLHAQGQLYVLVATGDREARKHSSVIIKSNRSRTDTRAADVTTKPTHPPTYALTSLPTKLLQTQPPTTRPSEPPKQQQVASDDPRIEVYSKLRGGRSGSAIQDMLYAHAYAFANGMQYMGACPTGCPIRCRHQKADQKLLNAIGLNSTLRIACPPGNTSSRVLLKTRQYRKDSYLSNEEWLKYIRSAVRCTKLGGEDGDNVMQVAVHIRRGDVRPCGTPRYKRYTPNSQYLEVLDQILQNENDSDTLPRVQVRIFSEKKSHESFDVFTKKNYSLHLDTGIADVWRAMVTADVVVMAKSSFSFVPTLLNGNATVLYTPFWHPPLPGWQTVSNETLKKSSEDLRELQANLHCDS
jgi:hypothetical protein